MPRNPKIQRLAPSEVDSASSKSLLEEIMVSMPLLANSVPVAGLEDVDGMEEVDELTGFAEYKPELPRERQWL